jgi:hemerythrin-like domain-containing protein
MAGVVSLIKEDHREVEQVFAKLEEDQGDKQQLLQQVAEMLIPHSKAEEQVVYPAIKKAVPDDQSDVDDGIVEHHHVEATLQSLLSMDPDDPGADGLIAAMIGEVRHHVEEEENDILPDFSKTLSSQELTELGEQFTQAKNAAKTAMVP